jgi:tetratricopeptide (TPR) repeat protein
MRVGTHLRTWGWVLIAGWLAVPAFAQTKAPGGTPSATQDSSSEAWQRADKQAFAQQAKAYEDLILTYNDAIAKNPDISWYYGARANAKRSLGRYDEALVDYTRAIGIDPGTAWYYAARAETKLKMHRMDDAIQDYDKAIQLDPQQRRFREALDRARSKQ